MTGRWTAVGRPVPDIGARRAASYGSFRGQAWANPSPEDRRLGLQLASVTAHAAVPTPGPLWLLEQENEILRRATAYFARDVLPK
jgi:hypothetical protein